jgi:hypothetical protein
VGLRQGHREGRQGWPLDKELQMLARGRLCGPEERRRCRAESGAFAEWACAVCAERVRPEAISPWTWHLVFLYQLSRAGYPFKANDLSLETWLLMGKVRRVLEGAQRGRHGYD